MSVFVWRVTVPVCVRPTSSRAVLTQAVFISGYTPFFAPSPMEMYEKILDHDQADDLDFPEFIKGGPEKMLVEGLLHPKKTKRLGNRKEGIKGIMEHDFFKGAEFDWNALADGHMPAPYVPKAIDFSDADNLPFDKLKEDGEEEEEEDEIPDDTSGWNPPF